MTFVETRLVVLLAFDGVSLLDLAGPLEALTVAATLCAPGATAPYRTVVASGVARVGRDRAAQQ
ncbi:hypothetical protein [Sorangium sp. So ce1153]|uniref:hypothetical protein n=1 Tax=Sorangium sp. So ce1153 TaxID=3133333 RepID=UPI003F62E2CA